MSDHTRASRARSCNHLAAVADVLVRALRPTDDEPHSWLIRVGDPTAPDCRPTTEAEPHRPVPADVGARTAEPPGHLGLAPSAARPTSPVATVSPPDACIHLLPLDPIVDSPLDALLGLVAPDDWWALGVAATARARHIDRPEQPGTAVLVLLLVDRAGQTVSRVPRLDGGGTYENLEVTAGPEGVLLDLCRRAFGLPTAPPEQPPMTWWAQLWLDALLRDAAVEPGRSWTWPALMASHPLYDLLHPLDGGDGDGLLGPDRFARAIEVVVAGYDWERLRRAGLVGPNRDLAAWMDEGCFARWTLGTNPDVSDLLAALQSLLPPDVVGPVAAVLDRWGVLA
jgi:hypothetical protein